MPIPSIWTGIYVEESASRAIRLLHECGWECFELCTEHLAQIQSDPQPEREIEAVVQALQDLRATMPQAHAHLRANIAHPEQARRELDMALILQQLPVCAQLGVRHVVLHPGVGTGHTTAEELRAIRELNLANLSRLADRAGELGLVLAIENGTDHARTGRRRLGARMEELLDLIATLGSPAVAVAFDSSHANVQKLDCGACIRQLGRHLVCTHLSDNNGLGDQHLTPGNGTVDWPGVVAALREIGYQGTLNLEIPGERHPVPEVLRLKMRHARAVAGWLAGELTQAR